MLKTRKKLQKIKSSAKPLMLVPYLPATIRGPLPANWYVAQMVVSHEKPKDK